MIERIIKFNPEFKNIGNRSVMRFLIKDGQDIIDYQLEMLKNNRITLLADCEVLAVDQETKLSYDITSLVTLKKILERKEIGRNEFIRYMNQIAGVFSQLENYLLDYGGILLDSDCIYGSLSDDRLYFLYIPDRSMPQNINEPLKEFIMRLIIQEMRFKNENSDNYIQKLIEALKTADFSLLTLKSYLDNLAKIKPGAEEMPQNQVKTDYPASAKPPVKEEAAHSKIDLPVGAKPQAKIETRTGKVKVYPLKSYLLLGGDILGLAVLFGTMILKGSFKPGNPDTLTSLAGLLLVGGAVTFLICSKAFSVDKKIEKEITKKIPVQVRGISQAVDQISAAQQRVELQGKVQYVNKAIRQPTPIDTDSNINSGQVRYDGADRTVLLSDKNISVPTLKRLGSNLETVMITRWPFRVGRLADQVDYCLMNPAIGKLHAELIKKPEGIFIADMNTRNGTFVNGSRVEANSERPLKSGDKIMLANEEFVFCE